MALAVPMIVFVLFPFLFPFLFPVMFVVMPLPMAGLILGHVHIIVPSVPDEIDGAATGIVLGAMLTPVFFMAGRYVQVDRLIDNPGRSCMNHDGFCVDNFRLRIICDVNAAIKAGLTDTDRHPDIGGMS